MDTLKINENIQKYVSELNGYLMAISDLNDAVGYRHGFSADLISLNGVSATNVIEQFLDTHFKNIQEINLLEEKKIIEKYIFNNFMLGEQIEQTTKILFIKEQLLWHIQEYITMAAYDRKEEGRWVYNKINDNVNESTVFIKVEDYLMVIMFKIAKNK